MPVGLQTWNADGVLMLDLTSRIGRVHETWSSGTVDGSRVIPRLADGGEPFVFIEDDAADLTLAMLYASPNVSINGTTVTWSFVDFTNPMGGASVPRRAVSISVGTF